MDINRNNYESYFLLYLDRELTSPDMKEVDLFLRKNADLQKEFDLLSQTIQVPSTIIFENKELLYRKEEKPGVVSFYWLRMAAAILVLLLGSWFIIARLSNHTVKTDSQKEVSVTKVTTPAKAEMPEPKANHKLQQPDNIANAQKGKTQIPPDRLVESKNTQAKNKNTAPNVLPDKTSVQDGSIQETPEEPILASTHTSQALTMQTAPLTPANDSKQIEHAAAIKAPGQLVLTTAAIETGQADNIKNNEPEYRSDNAISVVALNDRNKSITGFFKKLTKRSTADETADNNRKLRVSVFQINY